MNCSRLLWRSLKARVTLFTLAIFLLSLGMLAFYAGRVLREDMRRISGEQQLSTASFIAAEVHHELQDRLTALQTVAQGISPAMLGNPAALQVMLEQRPVFDKLFNAGFYVTGPDGTAISGVPTSVPRVGVNYLERDCIAAALKQGKASIGQPIIGKVVQAPVFVMAAPIRDPQGQVIGALAGVTELNTPNFLDIITTNRYGNTGSYLLVARQSRVVVAASDRSRVMKALRDPDIDLSSAGFMGGREDSEVVLNTRGVELLVSAKRVPAVDWFVVASIPTEEAFEPIRDMLHRISLAALLLALLAGALTWWMLRRELAPLLATVKTLTALPHSSLPPQPLPVLRHDEIGDLIVSFNRLLADLRQGSEALRDSEARYSTLIENSGEGIGLVDAAERFTFANPAAEELFGVSRGGLLGRTLREFTTPAQFAAIQAQTSQRQAGTKSVYEFEISRPDGEARNVLITAVPQFDAAGQFVGAFGVFRDITERRHIEDRLRLRESLLSAIIENFPGGLSMFDAELNLTASNQQFRQLLDFPDALFEPPVVRFEDFIRYNAQRNEYGPGDPEQQVDAAVARARNFQAHRFERVRADGTVLEIVGRPMPGGGFVTVYTDISERKRLEQQVHQMAFHDPLTQLPNRHLLGDRLSQAIVVGKRSGHCCALMFLDLDNFKPLNDLHGHDVGDLLLVEVARRLTNCVRQSDTVARIGGDEFVVLLNDLVTDKNAATSQAGVVAEKIRIQLALPYWLSIKHEGQADATIEHHCSASIGVVVFMGSEASQEELIKRADDAMYLAKQAGRNAVRFHADHPADSSGAGQSV